MRVRVAISWRARWLCVYAMSGSKAMACRQAHVSEKTADYHIKNDSDFAAVADAAKEHAIDLLHTRAFQRCLGDIEPIYWQGIVVGHVRKFDTRLQIEMLKGRTGRATFKTLGQAPVNVSTGDKILVMDEATRAKLMEARRQALMAMPGPERLNRPTVGQIMCNVAQLAAQLASRPTLDKTVARRRALIHTRQPIAVVGSGGGGTPSNQNEGALRRPAAFIIDPACWRLALPLTCSSSCRRSGRFRRVLR